jgi:nucleoside-diphosphate-sugar epimerase
MRALVTGAAGFIGSRLIATLHNLGWDCIGIDRLSDYYPIAEKTARIQHLSNSGIKVLSESISTGSLAKVGQVDVVFHLAAQPGVRKSWADFETYTQDNFVASQLVAEFARDSNCRIVFASSSSIYGEGIREAVDEEVKPNPYSPYGVTKAGCELLFKAYSENFGIPVVALRYFTVYGPGQRPDMAMRRIFESARHATTFNVYGDGSNSRQFTYVDDVVTATIRAAKIEPSGFLPINICGGQTITLSEVIELCEQVSGYSIRVNKLQRAAGDVSATHGQSDRAKELLHWEPQIELLEGLSNMWKWVSDETQLTVDESS